jgi:hypothetical protein
MVKWEGKWEKRIRFRNLRNVINLYNERIKLGLKREGKWEKKIRFRNLQNVISLYNKRLFNFILVYKYKYYIFSLVLNIKRKLMF